MKFHLCTLYYIIAICVRGDHKNFICRSNKIKLKISEYYYYTSILLIYLFNKIIVNKTRTMTIDYVSMGNRRIHIILFL